MRRGHGARLPVMPVPDPVHYRTFAATDIAHLRDIDRSEPIEGLYRVEGDVLALYEAAEDAPDWSDATRAEYAATLRDCLADGGHAVGAWDQERLAGFASLRTTGVGGDPTILQLDMLYVNRRDRGRGIGRELTRRIADAARARGATALYISATPTVNTVNAYLRMGAAPLAHPDPVLLAKEPDDIHLLLPLVDGSLPPPPPRL